MLTLERKSQFFGFFCLPQRRKQQQEQAQTLRTVLDVDLIEQRMRHGRYDPSGAFEVIGQILKSHCAPMRDPHTSDELI